MEAVKNQRNSFNKWSVSPLSENDGKTNMDVDLYLLESAISNNSEVPILRTYVWSEETVSLGANQNIDEADKFGSYPTVKRITGGQAVFHGTKDKELTYSTVMKHSGFGKKIYLVIGGILISFLESYGLKAGYGYSTKDYKNKFNCFESKTPGDIVVNEIKIIGSAQYRKDGYILQHGSIRLDLMNTLTGQNINYLEANDRLIEMFIRIGACQVPGTII